MNISVIDANLLVVLHTVLDEGSVTRAAGRLKITQSAVSNALGRLRAQLGDRLVVRSGRGLVPTPRALAMAPRLRAALAELDAALGEPAFDPATTQREFTFADTEELSQLPQLAGAFARRLPGAVLNLVVADDLAGALVSGRADAALGPDGVAATGLHHEVLYAEAAARVVRIGHPARRRAALAHYPEVVVELVAGDRVGSPSTRVGMRMPSYIAAALAVSECDHVTTIPERLARTLCGVLPLRIVELTRQPLPVALYWHARTHGDAGMQFFRAVIRDAILGRVRSRR